MPRLLLVSIVMSLMLNVPGFCWAGAPTDQLRAYSDKVLKVLEDPALTLRERRAAVQQIASEVFDVSETARQALGLHWQERTPAEREEFVKLFASLLQQAYISRVDEYRGERITYVGEQVNGDRAVVRARIVTRQGTEVPVESRLHQKQNRWLIYDVLFANLSLVSNYHAQFDRIIRTASYDELVKRLQSRVDALNDRETNTLRATAPPRR